MSSSFVSELGHIWQPLPMVVLGVPALLAGLQAQGLPETRGKPLPETFEEAIHMGLETKEVIEKCATALKT